MTDNNKPDMEIDKYGNKFWRLNGKYHREDGPAVEYARGTKSWWLNGEEVTEEEGMGKIGSRKEGVDEISR